MASGGRVNLSGKVVISGGRGRSLHTEGYRNNQDVCLLLVSHEEKENSSWCCIASSIIIRIR